ncbi:MAG TPA: hemerythrin domain-containing protein [Kofleriaceae bacterium]|nr:hemerythrin domain-containing protein [Kofleriaceae bacterium]
MKEKIKGFARKIGATFEGEVGILRTLAGEHAEVSTLMDDILSSDSPESKAEKHYPTIRKKLLLHLRAEQHVLYSACERFDETGEMIQDSRAEHREIEQLLGELDSMPVDAPAWMERFSILQRSVAEHVEDEEMVLFPRCKHQFESDQLRELDDDYKAAKDELEDTVGDISMHRTGTERPSV